MTLSCIMDEQTVLCLW